VIKKLAKRVRAGTLKLDGIVIETTGMYVRPCTRGRVRFRFRNRVRFRVR
jgi:hypothetical protein